MRPVKNKTYATEKGWLDARRRHITASEISVLFGDNPYKSIDQLFLEKAGIEDGSIPDSPAMWWGRRLEQTIGEAFQELYGGSFSSDHAFYSNGVLSCTLDGVWYRNPLIAGLHKDWVQWKTPEPDGIDYAKYTIEIKNSNSLHRKTLSPYYEWQVQQQLHLTRLTEGLLVAKVGANTLNAWCIKYDAPRMQEAERRAADFLAEVKELQGK